MKGDCKKSLKSYGMKPSFFIFYRISFEFPATGGVVPFARFRTVKLLKYVSAFDYFVMACEVIFVGFIFYYYVEEFLEIKKQKMSYFFSVWNNLDIIVLIVSIKNRNY